MFKFLLIIGLIFYVIYRVAGFFFKMVFLSAQQRSQGGSHAERQSQSRPKSGNINIDYVPQDKKHKNDFKGGDYVDFEEVK